MRTVAPSCPSCRLVIVFDQLQLDEPAGPEVPCAFCGTVTGLDQSAARAFRFDPRSPRSAPAG